MGRSWGCLFGGHEWVEEYTFRDVRGFGRVAEVSYLVCRRCSLVRDVKKQ